MCSVRRPIQSKETEEAAQNVILLISKISSHAQKKSSISVICGDLQELKLALIKLSELCSSSWFKEAVPIITRLSDLFLRAENLLLGACSSSLKSSIDTIGMDSMLDTTKLIKAGCPDSMLHIVNCTEEAINNIIHAVSAGYLEIKGAKVVPPLFFDYLALSDEYVYPCPEVSLCFQDESSVPTASSFTGKVQKPVAAIQDWFSPSKGRFPTKRKSVYDNESTFFTGKEMKDKPEKTSNTLEIVVFTNKQKT